jgi:hypothetical protein
VNPAHRSNPYLHIEGFWHRKGDPLPPFDFSQVISLFGVDPSDPLVNPEAQVARSPGDTLKVLYYTVRGW